MAKKPLHTATWIATHLAAAAIGWALWNVGRDESPREKEAATLSEKSHRERRNARSEHGMTGDQLLTKITNPTGDIVNAFSGGPTAYHDYLIENGARLINQADALQPAEDIAAAAIAAWEMQKHHKAGDVLTPEMIEEMNRAPLRFLHWMRADPAAALAFINETKGGVPELVVFAAVMEKGIAHGSDWVGVGQQTDTQIRRAVTILGGREGDPATLDSIKDKFPRLQWQDMRVEMAKSWPPEKADQLLQYATSERAAGFLLSYVLQQGKSGHDWLKAKIAAGEISENFKAEFAIKPQYRDLFLNHPDIPLQERIDGLAALSPDLRPNDIHGMLGSRDVTRALNNSGRDWRYAFRNGAATVDEIYESIAAELPELAATSPAAIKNQLFNELVEDNGTAAMALLSDLPETEKWEAALKPARGMFFNVNPQEFYDYLQQIPPDASEAAWQTRLESWSAHSRPSRDQLGSEYVQWVRNLPPGTDREMASYVLVRDMAGNHPELAASLRSEIKDERLIKRLTPSAP